MRFSVLTLCLLPGLSAADDIPLTSPVTAVTLYDHGAEIVRQVPFSVPAGQHQLILRDLPAYLDQSRVRIRVEGVQSGPVTLRSQFTPPRDRTPSPQVKAAEDAVEALERQIETQNDRAAAARLAIDAAAVRRQFLGDLGKAEGMATAGVDALRALSRMIGDEALDAARSAQSGEVEARRIERGLKDLREQLADAEQALAALTPTETDRAFVAVEVTAPADATGTMTVTYFTDNASWTPVYDLRLTRGAPGSLAIDRGAYVGQNTGESWQGVALTLSTARPSEAMDPQRLVPMRRTLADPQVASASSPRMGSLSGAVLEAPVIAEAVVSAALDLSGYVATYVYPTPVDIVSDADAVRLRLDTLTLSADLSARAVASRYGDAPGFLMAHVVNDSGEEILPAVSAALYVDGTFVGQQDDIAGIAAGDDADLFFGPIKGMSVSRVLLDENAANRGFISRSNEQTEAARIEVRNLTGEDWPVTLLDQVPYSAREDLQITWAADPRPTITDFEDLRGVLAWEFDLKAGESRAFSLTHKLTWPENMELR